MNDPLNESRLESLLRSLAPAAASPALAQRVDEELQHDRSWISTPATHRRKPHWLTSATWTAIGAAAAIAVMSFLPQAATSATLAKTPDLLPVSTLREWEDVQNEGIHYNDESLPEQHVRLFSRERQSWVDPQDGAQITIEYPREQKLVLPVAFQ